MGELKFLHLVVVTLWATFALLSVGALFIWISNAITKYDVDDQVGEKKNTAVALRHGLTGMGMLIGLGYAIGQAVG